MESKHSLRKSKLFRALLILLLIAVPVQWAAAQLTLSTPRTTLGTVIKQIQSQSKYQFFYNDKLSTVTVEPLKVKDASLEQVLNTLLKNKDISYKIEENIIYLSEKENSDSLQQQSGKERTITGQVVDAKGEPLIGVSILVKGTTDGAITDLDGNYKIVTKSNNPVIVYSYIGYKTQEIPLKGQTAINITMMDDTQVIDEVVVTALGIKRSEKALSYNVTQVDAESALAVKDANSIIPVVNNLIDYFNEINSFIIATKDWHPLNHKSFAINSCKEIGEFGELEGLPQVFWPIHCVQDTFGSEFHKDLSPIENTVYKGQDFLVDSYSGFFDNGKKFKTNLDDILKKNEINTLYIGGLATDYCVKYTVLDALSLSYKVFLLTDCIKGVNINTDDSDKSIEEMKQKGAHLINSKEILNI